MVDNKLRLEIQFGMLAPKAGEQLSAQHVKFHAVDAGRFDSYITAMNRLWIKGLLTDSEKNKVAARIMKSLTQTLEAQTL